MLSKYYKVKELFGLCSTQGCFKRATHTAGINAKDKTGKSVRVHNYDVCYDCAKDLLKDIMEHRKEEQDVEFKVGDRVITVENTKATIVLIDEASAIIQYDSLTKDMETVNLNLLRRI